MGISGCMYDKMKHSLVFQALGKRKGKIHQKATLPVMFVPMVKGE